MKLEVGNLNRLTKMTNFSQMIKIKEKRWMQTHSARLEDKFINPYLNIQLLFQQYTQLILGDIDMSFL